MSLIPNLSDIPEQSVVPTGIYDLRIIKAQEKTSKMGRKGIMQIIEIVSEDNALNIFDTLWLPMDSDDEGKKMTMLRMLKERLQALNLPTDGSVELADFAGLEFSASVVLTEDPEYGNKNEIKKIL